MTILGWDMSHYDAPSIGTALDEGIAFITHKAGGDSRSGDPELTSWWSGVRKLPKEVVLGAYWVLRPDLDYSWGKTGAAAFLAALDSKCPGWRDRDAFILQVDCEIWNGDSGTKPSAAVIQGFCNLLMSSTGNRYRPIVYASKGQYGNSLTSISYPLWNANYPYSSALKPSAAYAKAGGDSGPGWTTYSGQMPAIWQYTSSAVIGGQTTSDANAFKGSILNLKRLVTPGASMTAQLNDDDVQAILNGIYRDLKNRGSGIAQELAEMMDEANARALNVSQPWTGGAGQRIQARGWSQMSVWLVLEYLLELVATDPKAFADGTAVSGGIIPRLDRIENRVTPEQA